eukprot:TRINITY_DN4208_c0_g1_i1.p1 TRINITY_DN4208_c0_g1~~TRINITY_DN4208_c0_g1_i1.p1  ORF type:complete len:160 (+),score=20.56 TRINITY_DN4208_c0_g1_i1:63-482(+)
MFGVCCAAECTEVENIPEVNSVPVLSPVLSPRHQEEVVLPPTAEDEPDPETFEVCFLKKTKDARLGLDIKKKNTYLLIKGLKEAGLAVEYNEVAKSEGKTLLGANQIIVAVNGKMHDSKVMLEEFASAAELRVQVRKAA